ncbi:hypothetical protein N8I74_18370 [Chitiniphilus purpureus]|uniref:Uncharacterized protein n=1 Tax=Chitiniphilus purpureus TaxID=2981137 RepID=A0ABY6DTR6_9NEIS|nr:hypothetical protein [Chitiniphilus sp. CD1]UXY15253.1 hypothetical protein N8I74_18370 [Chitiniphilus sp. CD1]
MTRHLLLLLLSPACCAADGWGRLFYTPQERVTLERPAVPQMQAQSRRLDGEVRHGTRLVRFVDGRPVGYAMPSQIRVGERWAAPQEPAR